MSIEENKKIVQKFYDAIQVGDYELVKELCHPEFVFYHQIDTPHFGAEGFIASEAKNFAAFEGFSMKIENLIAQGNRVAAYLVFEGNQSGEIFGHKPAGAKLRFSLMMMLTIKNNKIIEKRAHFDRLDIMNQLEVL